MTVANLSTETFQVSDGVQTVFTFDFQIQGGGEPEWIPQLSVYENKVLTGISYTISAVTDAGGTLTFATPPAAGVLLIDRNVPETQGTVFPVSEAFPPKAVENSLDKNTLNIQELLEKSERSFRFDKHYDGVTPMDFIIPDYIADRLWSYDPVTRKVSLTAFTAADIQILIDGVIATHPGVSDTATAAVLFLSDTAVSVIKQFASSLANNPQISAVSGSTTGVASYRLQNDAGEYYDIEYDRGSQEGIDHFVIRDSAGIARFSLRGDNGHIGIGSNNYNPPAYFGVKTDSPHIALDTVLPNIDVIQYMYENGNPRWGFIGKFSELTNRYIVESYGISGTPDAVSIFPNGVVSLKYPAVEAWNSFYSVIQIGANAAIIGEDGPSGIRMEILQNCYFDGTNHFYQDNGPASIIEQSSGDHSFRSAISGIAGNVITWQNPLILREGGGVVIRNMTTAQRNTIVGQLTGEEIFNTTTNLKNYWNGAQWMQVTATVAP